jgi:Subtilase family
MSKVIRHNNFSGDAGAADVDPAGGFADADLRAPAAAPQTGFNGIAQFNGMLPASFERGVSASVGASPSQTGAAFVSAPSPISHGMPEGGGAGPNGATRAQVLQAIHGTTLTTTGAGVMVGVMSDSFNNLGGAAADEMDGGLPPAANVLVLKDYPSGGTDEGRAMMQVVHDIAPGSNLAFYSATISEQDFANGIIALANAGCKVICDDYAWPDEPFFETGVVANAIQQVEAQGVIFVTCAGNQAASAYQSGWNSTNTTYDYYGQTLTNTLNFGTVANPNPVQTITVGNGASALIVQWNQPYGSITSGATNLAVVVFSNGSYVGTYDNTNDATPEPTNPFIQVNLNANQTYQIAIEVESGPVPSSPFLVKDEVYNFGMPSVYNTIDGANVGTVRGHHTSTDAITVGAVDTANTPGNGGTLQSQFFSSSGAGTQLWFNYNGSTVPNPPQLLSPVAISGVDGIATSVFPAFFGTSCATPTVAAVVANMPQINPALTLAQIEQIFQQTALPFGSALVAGAGLVDALAAVTAAMSSSPPAGTSANMVLYSAAGLYDIYNIGANSVLASYQLGLVGTDWAFATLGGFNDGDTSDMLLRNSTSGGFQVYDIANNSIYGSFFLGNVGLNWQVMGFGNFSSLGETDMIMSNTSTGGLQVYDINNNQITYSALIGTVGTNWQFSGVGNFSGRGTSDMLLRNMNTGGLQVYDINSNQITGSALIGTVGVDWQFSGVGNFSSVPGETDLLLRNVNTGGLQVYDINNNQLTGSASIGQVGLDWQYAGVAAANGAGTSDLVLSNVNSGAVEVYDIANNQIMGAASLAQPGPNWQVGGFAAASPTGSAALAQLVQAMAGLGGGSDAAENLNTATLSSDTAQQPLLTTSPHG